MNRDSLRMMLGLTVSSTETFGTQSEIYPDGWVTVKGYGWIGTDRGPTPSVWPPGSTSFFAVGMTGGTDFADWSLGHLISGRPIA